MNYPVTIKKFGYTITLHSANEATVSGGILTRPVTIRKLLGKGDQNPKTAKNIIKTVGLSIMPWQFIGFGNVCPFAVPGVCPDSCLAWQGQGPMPGVYMPRAAKTVLWYLARGWFIEKLNRELARFRQSTEDETIGARLNMFSDIEWEKFGVIDQNPFIGFYDYTKNPNRHGMVLPNYWVTLSYDGTNDDVCRSALAAGHNVSAVFFDTTPGPKCGRAAHSQILPYRFMDADVIDGGKTDWRPDDPRGVVVGLRLLSRTYATRLQAIASGFARWVDEENRIAV